MTSYKMFRYAGDSELLKKHTCNVFVTLCVHLVQDRLEKLNKNVARETARQRAAIESSH